MVSGPLDHAVDADLSGQSRRESEHRHGDRSATHASAGGVESAIRDVSGIDIRARQLHDAGRRGTMATEPDIIAAVSFQNSQHITFDSSIVTQTSGAGLEFISCIDNDLRRPGAFPPAANAVTCQQPDREQRVLRYGRGCAFASAPRAIRRTRTPTCRNSTPCRTTWWRAIGRVFRVQGIGARPGTRQSLHAQRCLRRLQRRDQSLLLRQLRRQSAIHEQQHHLVQSRLQPVSRDHERLRIDRISAWARPRRHRRAPATRC